MIPGLALFKGKGLLASAIAAAALLAWGGLGWWGKARVERDFEAYRGEQARLVVRQQETIIAEQQRAAEKAQEASNAYQKGARDIRARWDAERLRNQQRTGSGALPATSPAASGPDAACEDRLHGALRSLEAVDRAAGAVAEGLRDAELCAAQLSQLQAFCGR